MKKRVHLAVLISLVLTLSIILFATDASALTISNAYPTNQANYNPRLSVDISDSTTPLTVIFETNTTGTWTEIGRQNGANGVYTYDTTGMDVKNKRYYWRVRVDNGTDLTEQTYSFVAQAFVLKWTYDMNLDASLTTDGALTYIGPLAVDVNKDGIYEVFATGVGKVVSIDGLTGKKLWEYSDSNIPMHAPFEIGDLNNDGIPELVVVAVFRTIALHADTGEEYWNVDVESGDHHPIILDTDGNKYPYVYVTSADIAHMEDGTGRLRKLNGTNGVVVKETFAWKPCWGGLSAADANNDGKFEIYASDRSIYYHPPNLAMGPQAYDADNLTLLWNHEDILASSHAPEIIDVNKDGILDVVVLNQASGGGICVIDGVTGGKMPGKCNLSLGVGTHSSFPIYDIDGDGSLEIIVSRDSTATVWDVDKWQKEIVLDYFVEPPKMADVIGDSRLEIIGGDANRSGQIWVYDQSYALIEKISGVQSIPMLIVQDIDNDGQNEIVSITSKGVVKAYETSAYAPTPRVRTNNMYYSERKMGVGVYVPPPGAPQAFIYAETPADGSTNVSLNPTLSFRAVDYRHDLLDIEISTDASGSWETVATFNNVENGVYSYTPDNMDKEGKVYNWRVNVIDSHADNIPVTKTFSFTTFGVNVTESCGDGACNGNENCSSCVSDCGVCLSCGDGVCNGNENCSSCVSDCGVCPVVDVCGDSICGVDENCSSCVFDCGVCPVVSFCGDNICEGDEDCSSCVFDCGVCPVVDVCGDGVCNGNENCSSCVSDCGSCPINDTNTTNNTSYACNLTDRIWDEDTSLNNAYNLSECFANLVNGSVIYRVSGNSSISVKIGIDGSVNLSAPANWYGSEYVIFNASAGNRSAISNSVMLLVRSVPDCGDAICEGGETCSNCAADCGKCSSSGGGGGGGRSSSYRSTSSVSTSQNVTNTSIKSDGVGEVVCSDWSSCKLGTQQRTCTGNKTIIEERICPSSEQTTSGPSTSSLLILNESDSDDLNSQKSLLTGAVTGTNKSSRPIWIVVIIAVIVSLVAVQILIKRKIKRKSF